MRTHSSAALLIATVAATAVVTSGPAAATTCVPPVGTLVGRLVEIDGRSVSYRVETYQPSGYKVAPGSSKPIPGHLVVVQ
jgi:hypothetical protein